MYFVMNLDNYCRKVIVHYGGKTSCLGKKFFILPAITIGRSSDLEILREKIHKEIMAHLYLQQNLGENKSTKVNEVCIFQYDECFSQPTYVIAKAKALSQTQTTKVINQQH